MHALQQDGRDQNASDGKAARWWKRRGESLSTADRDRFLLAVAISTRLNEVSPAEFQLYCDQVAAEASD